MNPHPINLKYDMSSHFWGTAWIYVGDLKDRPPAAKVEAVTIGGERVYQVSFHRPGNIDPFRVKRYVDRARAFAVAGRYVRFCLAQPDRARYINTTLLSILRNPSGLSWTEHLGVFAKPIDGELAPNSPAITGPKDITVEKYVWVASNAAILDFYEACFGAPETLNARQITRAARALIKLRNDFGRPVTARVTNR
jgi:hypothetical protein